MTPADPTPGGNQDPEAAEAAAWLARRDRGFTSAEQDAFLAWLAADPRHGTQVARLERSWQALDALAAWQPADALQPNPDLLDPRPGRWSIRRPGLRMAAAAAIFVLAGVGLSVWVVGEASPAPAAPSPAIAGLRVIPRPEPMALEDGSLAQVNHGGRMELAYAPEERRVRLREGEAHFTVRREPGRPFIVEVGDVTVRAVGTAFSVRRSPPGVEVLVTEGRVEVAAGGQPPVFVAMGERARVGVNQVAAILPTRPDVIERELAWRAVRLEFDAMPLAAVVAEFNLRNTLQLEIGDAAAGQLRVAGTFQADKPDSFARLLEAGFGITVERRAGASWLLRSVAPAVRP